MMLRGVSRAEFRCILKSPIELDLLLSPRGAQAIQCFLFVACEELDILRVELV